MAARQIFGIAALAAGGYMLARQFGWLAGGPLFPPVSDWERPPAEKAPAPSPSAETPLDRVMARAGGPNVRLNADQWGWFYALEAGQPAPAPETYGVPPVGEPGRDTLLSGPAWWAMLTGAGLAGLGHTGYVSLFQPFGPSGYRRLA